jgi:hypothetical protein
LRAFAAFSSVIGMGVRAFPRALVQQPSVLAASDGTRTLRMGPQRLDTTV